MDYLTDVSYPLITQFQENESHFLPNLAGIEHYLLSYLAYSTSTMVQAFKIQASMLPNAK